MSRIKAEALNAKSLLKWRRTRDVTGIFSFTSTLTVFSIILGFKWVILIYSMYYIFMCKKISLYYQPNEPNKSIVSKLKGLEKVFYPHILWMFPQIQTIAYWVRSIPKNKHTEIEIEQDDGGSFFLHVYEPEDTPEHTVVLLHGLGGSVHSKHVTILGAHLLNEKYRVVIMGARGTFHLLKTPVFFHIGWTKDLVSTFKYVLETYSGSVSGIGFSMGGHWLSKTFGELPKHFSEEEQIRIKGGMAISTPFDFVKLSEYMLQPIPKRIYNRSFAKKIHKFVIRNKEVFLQNNFQVSEILKAHTMHEIDQLLTIPAFKIEDIEKYYYSESCVRVIRDIRKPFLILNSKDDPIVPLNSIPISECLSSPSVILALTERGGHMGFLGYSSHMTYAEEAAMEFIKAITE
ncbi:abhydrolase domain-containing protein 1/3 [Nematocida sp. LUAm3]|nr:abhydrolase domain-containing protein 1/3 [Nematocida sp. LUAm3]KAI5173925.1 abhydrolase domain-containing protein 1/3 [Nematocida sp. LUAm2]KAI5177330.1 abhydrolase domain-containing protein 1/3 [Nematocida sp. LUAm1]